MQQITSEGRAKYNVIRLLYMTHTRSNIFFVKTGLITSCHDGT